MRREIITESQFNGQPIRADENNPVIANIIQKFQEQLEYMTGKRCRVLVAFCIARFPQGWYIANPNEIISRVMRKLRQKADYEQTLMQTLWTREQDTSINPHFNIICIADAKMVKNGFTIKEWLNDIWTRELGLDAETNLIHLTHTDPRYFPPAAELGIEPGYEMKIHRNSPEEQVMKDNAVNMLSYFAKEHTKESIPSGYRAYGASRIPSENQE